ncbi:bryoporin [Carassius auratus]|uniref:Bryoporin-like n=1 Tax=Carassius auratus TaxID=7957 RepID=A0A6P6JT45_CARAU|nr:bryoporin-like [Carassius auratus]XP_026062858.1 bryoporin-like [Carassius auratus]XP_052402761.1 bryoporin-like [Carassius gibelio]XP_052402769.1 bryoporin-like [Carassius gibelio]
MQNAEAVSATINTNRNCTVEITNVSSNYCLINPKVYMSSGFSYHPPQPTIRTAKTEVCSFTKDDNTATGAVGILTYDLFHMQNRMCTERMAILFSVPFDYHLYKNVMGIGLFESSRGCDKALYKHMYEGKDFSQFTRADVGGSGITHRGKKIDLRATMSTVGKAIIKLEVYDKMG